MADAAARRAFVAEHVGSDLAYILDDSSVGEQLQSVLVRRASGGSRPLSARLVFCLAPLPTAVISACEKGQRWQQAFVGRTRVLPGATAYSRDQCL